MNQLGFPLNKPLDLFSVSNQDNILHQRRQQNNEDVFRQSKVSLYDSHQSHGAVVPPSKNLYYQMKDQLQNVVNYGNTSNQEFIKQQRQSIHNLYNEAENSQQTLKGSLSATHFYHTQMLTTHNKDDGNILYPASPHNKLYKNGIRVTLGQQPVKFNKKVFIGNDAPRYARPRISISGQPNRGIEIEADDFKLMPMKKRVLPLVTPSDALLKIDSDNKNFNRKSHENFFNDYFGFKDKGKKPLNDDQPLKQKLNREFDIVNNRYKPESNNVLQDSPRIGKDVRTQMNTVNRYFIPPEYEMTVGKTSLNTRFSMESKKMPTNEQPDKLEYLKRIEKRAFNNATQLKSIKMRQIDPKQWGGNN